MERIENYTDYRKFLQDYYQDQKKKFKFFSYRYFCKKSGVTSHSLLRSVMQGKRNLTETTLAACIKGMGLTELDARYFRNLVLFNQSKTDAEKNRHLLELRNLRRKVDQKLIPIDRYDYYLNWYNIAIRELACLMDWGDDYARLANALNPPITKSQARKSVELLLKLGLLIKQPDGKFRQADPAITTGPEVLSVAIREVNRQMSELGVSAIQRTPPNERDVSSLVVGVSKNSYSLIKQEIQEFKNRVVRIVDDDPKSDSVFNLNVQLFPLSTPWPLEEKKHE
jgi:uncharacterized protein (TIGR02147 family)